MRGFMLIDPIIALLVVAMLQSSLIPAFRNHLNIAVERRRQQEALRIALSCFDVVEAEGSAPSEEWFEENMALLLDDYEIAVSLSGGVCEVEVSWPGWGMTHRFRLSRQVP